MKKIRYIAVPLVILCIVISAFVVACKEALATPQNVAVDTENYMVSWSRVDNARGYEVEITGIGTDYKETVSVSRSKLYAQFTYLEANDYSVRVRAIAGNNTDYANSAWSEAQIFTKDYFSGCTYTLVNNNTEYEITGWTKPTGDDTSDVIITETYRGKPVVGIGDSAFKSKSTLTSITVEGDNLRYVGKNAFYSCTRLKSIYLPDSVTEIGSGAFHSCGVLESFTVPSGVTTIEDSTFLYCRNIENVDLGNVETIGETAFYGCNKALKKIVIPDSVTSIGEKAFSLCSVLEEVEIGSGIETIGEYAFQKDPMLTSVKFEEDLDTEISSLAELGSYSFSDCTALEEVVLPQGLEVIDSCAFYGDTALSSVNIPETVEKIGYNAFGGTEIYNGQGTEKFVYVGKNYAAGVKKEKNKLWVLDYNSSVIEETDVTADSFEDNTIGIADYAFYAMKNVNSLTLPEQIEYIGDFAFYGSSFWQVNISGGTDSSKVSPVYIGSYSFSAMTSLSALNFSLSGRTSGVKSIGDHAFYGCSGLGNTFMLPSSIDSIGAYAFNNTGITAGEDGVMYAGNSSGKKWVVGRDLDTLAQTVYLDEATYGLSDYAFTRSTDLVSVHNLDQVTNIGEGAFYKCSSLSEAYLSTSIDTIQPYTFYDCSALTAIGDGYTHFSSLTTIGRSAFYDCESLSFFSMDRSRVREIGKYAFYKCTSLASIDLNSINTLETIDDYAFYRSGLRSVVIPSSVTYVGAKAFYKCESLTDMSIEDGEESVELGDYCFYKCSVLDSINLPGSVKSVGDYSFYKCDAVTKLSLGEGLEHIGKGAFAGLKITKLRIPTTVRYIGSYAFKSCSQLKSVVIPGSVEEIGDHAFYGINDATFFTDAGTISGKWSVRFNSSYRPMVWGCELSEDGDYVVSVTAGVTSLENIIKDTETKYSRVCGSPERDGYVFLGWSTSEGGAVEILAEDLDEALASLPEGTVVYSVWEFVGYDVSDETQLGDEVE